MFILYYEKAEVRVWAIIGTNMRTNSSAVERNYSNSEFHLLKTPEKSYSRNILEQRKAKTFFEDVDRKKDRSVGNAICLS